MVLSTAAALLGSIGSIASAGASWRRANLAQKRRDAEHRRQQNWYDRQLGSDYIDKTDFKSVLGKQRDLLNDAYRRSRNVNIVGGGTEESLAAQKALANQAVAESTSSIASNASAYKDSIERSKMAENQAYSDASAANAEAQAAKSHILPENE